MSGVLMVNIWPLWLPLSLLDDELLTGGRKSVSDNS